MLWLWLSEWITWKGSKQKTTVVKKLSFRCHLIGDKNFAFCARLMMENITVQSPVFSLRVQSLGCIWCLRCMQRESESESELIYSAQVNKHVTVQLLK